MIEPISLIAVHQNMMPVKPEEDEITLYLMADSHFVLVGLPTRSWATYQIDSNCVKSPTLQRLHPSQRWHLLLVARLGAHIVVWVFQCLSPVTPCIPHLRDSAVWTDFQAVPFVERPQNDLVGNCKDA